MVNKERYKWGEAIEMWNIESKVDIHTNSRFVYTLNENSSMKELRNLYDSLDRYSNEERFEVSEKSYTDLSELYAKLNARINEDSERLLDSDESFYIRVKLESNSKEVIRRCEKILLEKEKINSIYQADKREYGYYVNSISWYNTRLTLINNFINGCVRKDSKIKLTLKGEQKKNILLYSTGLQRLTSKNN